MGKLFSRFFSPRPDKLRKGKEIGRGSYGVVLEGTLGTRPIAIKRVHRILRDYARVTQEALETTLEAFKRECDLLEKAKSPYIVEFLGVYNEEDSVLLVMELMHQTLDQYLKDHKGRLPLEKQLDICYQVSCGLLFLHQYDPQILHRETRRMGNLLSRFFSHRPDQLLKGEEIGRGAYGLVLRGTLGTKPVAIKQVHRILRDYARVTQEALEATLEAFRRECDLLEKAKSPHIVEFLGVYNEEDSFLLVMELMHQTLHQYLIDHKGHLPLEKQVDICYQVSCGLLFLHQYDPQILHRDVTAKNILLNEDGSIVKISDLGQAKFRPSNIQYLSTKAPGCVVYMPPECLGDRPRFTAKSDTFSFGVVMLHVFTQEPPSCGLMNIGAKPEIERRADDLSKLSDDHPLKSLVVACLDDDPSKRPDMSEAQSLLDLHETGSFEGYQKLKSELSKDEEIFRSEQLLQDNSTLHSIKLPNLPVPTYQGTVTRIGKKLYVSGGVGADWESERLVQSFDLETATWSTLPPAPVTNSEAAVINGHLTMISGFDASTRKVTNQVWSWDEENKEWRNTIPSMSKPRWRPGVVQTSSVVAVLGGCSNYGTVLSTVDVLHTATLQWTTSPLLKLPRPMWLMSTATCDGHLYIACGRDRDDRETKRVFKLSLDLLEQSVAGQHVQDDPPQCQWIEVENTPFYSSGLLPTSRHPLVVGGRDSSGNSSSVISVFDSSANEWSNVGHCGLACRRPCLLSISSSSFLVLGGYTDPKNFRQSSLNTCELHYF